MTGLTKQIVKITSDLIQIPSVSSDLEKLAQTINYVRDFFGEINGMYVDEYTFNDKPNIIIKNFDGKEADVVLNGHLDVVPEQDKSQYKPKIVDGKLYGRWSADMKSGCAIMMVLMREVLTWNNPKKIMLMLTTDEEVGGFDGVNELVKLGYTGKVILIPDGGSLSEIVYTEKGIVFALAKSKWVACHASKRRLGKNAINNIIDFYHDIKNELEEKSILNPENNYRSTTVNLTNITAGSGAYNIIPDDATAKFDIRFTQKYNLEKLKNILENKAKKYDIEITTSINGEVLYTDPNHELIQKYYLTAKEVLWNDVRLIQEHCGCDGRFFADSVVILHQPNRSDIHWVQEHSYIDSYEKLYNIYKNFLYFNK